MNGAPVVNLIRLLKKLFVSWCSVKKTFWD